MKTILFNRHHTSIVELVTNLFCSELVFKRLRTTVKTAMPNDRLKPTRIGQLQCEVIYG
jgi:hypothetical protein